MRYFNFPSVAKPSWRYRLYDSVDDNPAHDYRNSSNSLSSNLSQYDTMGDGEVQHSPDCIVPREDFPDVLLSLHLVVDQVEIPKPGESVPSWLARFWMHYSGEICDKTIKFALSLNPKPGKPIYYNLSDLKKSTSDLKRHDRRWVQLYSREENDCPIERVMGVLCGDTRYQNLGLVWYLQTINRIAKYVDAECATFMVTQYLLRQKYSVLPKGRTEVSEMLENFDRLDRFVDALTTICWVRKCPEIMRNNMALKASES